MYSHLSSNQLAEWNHNIEQTPIEDPIDEYFECLIECDDSQSSCRRLCGDLLK